LVVRNLSNPEVIFSDLWVWEGTLAGERPGRFQVGAQKACDLLEQQLFFGDINGFFCSL